MDILRISLLVLKLLVLLFWNSVLILYHLIRSYFAFKRELDIGAVPPGIAADFSREYRQGLWRIFKSTGSMIREKGDARKLLQSRHSSDQPGRSDHHSDCSVSGT